MILDTSAIIAITQEEPGYVELLRKMESAANLGIGAPTLVEVGLVLSARVDDAESLIAEFLRIHVIHSIPFGETHWRQAIRAFMDFGKGRHPAKLNFGDCLSYATAKVAGQPLLCVGNDFARTDLELA